MLYWWNPFESESEDIKKFCERLRLQKEKKERGEWIEPPLEFYVKDGKVYSKNNSNGKEKDNIS
jgi:hypothetical protein